MVLDLVVIHTDDGVNAEVPSIKGCESWAHTEEEVISRVIELVYFYLKLPEETKLKIDRARRESRKTVYKIIFNK